MPKKTLGDIGVLPKETTTLFPEPITVESGIGNSYWIGYNQALSEISQIPLSKVLEKVEWDVLKIKEMLNIRCMDCKPPHNHPDCQITCSILAHHLSTRLKECTKNE